VDQMMAQGLLQEAKALYERGIPLDHPSMMGLGYRQLFMHLSGQLALDDAIELIKVQTRRFAKRQMTWFSRDLRIHWIDMDTQTDMDALIRRIADRYRHVMHGKDKEEFRSGQ
jgi:tRNA dimethylallyltransferase